MSGFLRGEKVCLKYLLRTCFLLFFFHLNLLKPGSDLFIIDLENFRAGEDLINYLIQSLIYTEKIESG